jgi:hypothetical protein
MKLHKIQIRHCAPKDCKESIVSYVLANNENQILSYIDKELLFGTWSDRHVDSLEDPISITDNEGNTIGTELYKEKMLRLRGEFNDEDADYSDAYYGVTHYGWDEGITISNEEAETLIKLNIVLDLRI